MANEKEKTLTILRRPRLTKGQKDLLHLIDGKLKANEQILYVEAEEIWINKVCRMVKDGIPYYWNYWHKEYIDENGEKQWHGGYDPLPKSWLPTRVLLWLTANIGSLVLKGYLEVIPRIELKQIKQQL